MGIPMFVFQVPPPSGLNVFVNRRFNRPAPLRAAEIIQMVTRGEELLSPPLLQDKTTYGRVNSPPPPPQGGSTRGQTTYGQNPTFTSQTKQTSPNQSDSDIHGMYGRDDPRTPPSPKANGLQGHSIYGRDNPSVPTPPKPAAPIRPVLSEYARINGSSESTDLATSVVNLLASYAIRVFNLYGAN
ncbi:hypothetical protein CTI12_AA068060 [Artemisia annua]|uniref:Uncharacterized protein n=1 Tax=Artemisia annua TaxID=35608 RepID=A0A2U1Q710_ARTAN|nr:hypothetical protein CTI12_AA068060 [Artemisia annua]